LGKKKETGDDGGAGEKKEEIDLPRKSSQKKPIVHRNVWGGEGQRQLRATEQVESKA